MEITRNLQEIFSGKASVVVVQPSRWSRACGVVITAVTFYRLISAPTVTGVINTHAFRERINLQPHRFAYFISASLITNDLISIV